MFLILLAILSCLCSVQVAGRFVHHVESARTALIPAIVGQDIANLMAESKDFFTSIGGYRLPELKQGYQSSRKYNCIVMCSSEVDTYSFESHYNQQRITSLRSEALWACLRRQRAVVRVCSPDLKTGKVQRSQADLVKHGFTAHALHDQRKHAKQWQWKLDRFGLLEFHVLLVRIGRY